MHGKCQTLHHRSWQASSIHQMEGHADPRCPPETFHLAATMALSRGPATHDRFPRPSQGCPLTWGHTLHYAFLGFGACERKHTVRQCYLAKNPLASGHGRGFVFLLGVVGAMVLLAPPAKTQPICRRGRRDQLPSPVKSMSTFVSGVG